MEQAKLKTSLRRTGARSHQALQEAIVQVQKTITAVLLHRTPHLLNVKDLLLGKGNYSATFLRNSSRSNFRESSTSATVWGETRPISPIHLKNFLNEARYLFMLATEAHKALRGNQSAKNQ
jgi:hypothetical protein